jgi:mannosyltransferase
MYGISGWRSLTHAQRCALGAIVIVALMVRVLGIASESLWVDEAASWGFSRLPLSELWGVVPTYEPHPPMYYTLLKFWSMLAGTSETGLRLLSTVAGVVTVYFAFVLGRLALEDEKGTWIALCGAAIVALHPTQIHFSQEARAYALQTLGVVMTLVASCWWLKNPAALAVTPRKLLFGGATENKAVALFVGGTTLALWMHHTGIVLLGCLLALNAILIIAASSQRNRTTTNLLLLGLAILVLWIPCGFFLLETIGPLNESGHVLPPGIYQLGFSFDYLFGPGLTTAIHSTTGDYLAGGFTGLFALAGAAALVRRGEPLVATLLCSGAALPVLVALVVSYTIEPMFAERAMIWVQIPYALLIASCTLWITALSVRLAGLAAFVAWFAVASPIERSRLHKEPWRQIVELLEKEAGPDDLIMGWYDYAQVPLQYYHAAERIKAPRLRLWKSGGEYPTMSAAISPLDRLSTDEVLARVSEALDVKGTVWVVTFSSVTSPVVIGMHHQLTALRGPPILRTNFILRGTESTLPPVQLSEYRANSAK